MSTISAANSATVSAPPGGHDTYTVQSGDTLSAIAAAHGVSLSALEAANPQIQDPNLILPGEQITIPAGAASNQGNDPQSYTVQAGDTLSGIGERFGINWHVLAQMNQLSNPNLILTGQTLRIGGSGNGASSGGTPTGGAQGSGSTTAAPGPSGPLPASIQGRVNEAMQYFESQGWTRAQAAGIVANLYAESGLNPGIQQEGGGPGYGLGQWEGPRQAEFQAWAGRPIQGSSFGQQLQFVQYELTHGESAAGNALHGAQNASQAGAIVTEDYERPADIKGQSQYRAGIAQQIYNGSAP